MVFSFALLLSLAALQFPVDRVTSFQIEQVIQDHIEEVIKIRRYLHMNPELSNREFETAKLVASKLLSLGMEVKTGIAETGVSGLLTGSNQGVTIGLRADMDALPIQEESKVPFRSLNPGVMHACGHDIHTAVVLGTAMVLNDLKFKLKGNIKFVFQPAEEGPPQGEEGGASLMIKQGVLENPPVRAMFGMHVWPETPVGTVLFSPGPIMASSDSFEISIKGKSAHGARPHEGIDAIALAAQTITSIHSSMSRIIDPADPAVVTIGKIKGGIRSNILAESVTMNGTVRTLTRTNRNKIQSLLDSTARNITQVHGATYSLNYNIGAPPVYNHPELAAIMIPALEEIVGKEKVFPLSPQMVAEDFSEFSQKIPGFFFFLGVRSKGKRAAAPLHNPYFDPDEKSIALGIKIFCYLLLDCLEHQNHFASNTL